MITHGGNIWDYRDAKPNIIDFSASINPLGFPKGTKKIIAQSIDMLKHYSEPDAYKLINSIAKNHKLSSENVIAGNGSIELIYLLVNALMIKRALIPVPTFTEYEQALKVNNVEVEYLTLLEKESFRIDIEKMMKTAAGVDLIFICNPNNPTGSLVAKDDLFKLAEYCKREKKYLVIDEAFIEFTNLGKAASLIKETQNNKYLIVLRSLTKIYSIPGLRLGYLAAHKYLAKRISSKQYPWNINTIAQQLGQQLIKEEKFVKATVDFISQERNFLVKGLSEFGSIKLFNSDANFILCKLLSAKCNDAKELRNKLLTHNILIRNCTDFRKISSKFFRIAVRTRDENKKLIKSLTKYLT